MKEVAKGDASSPHPPFLIEHQWSEISTENYQNRIYQHCNVLYTEIHPSHPSNYSTTVLHPSEDGFWPSFLVAFWLIPPTQSQVYADEDNDNNDEDNKDKYDKDKYDKDKYDKDKYNNDKYNKDKYNKTRGVLVDSANTKSNICRCGWQQSQRQRLNQRHRQQRRERYWSIPPTKSHLFRIFHSKLFKYNFGNRKGRFGLYPLKGRN